MNIFSIDIVNGWKRIMYKLGDNQSFIWTEKNYKLPHLYEDTGQGKFFDATTQVGDSWSSPTNFRGVLRK